MSMLSFDSDAAQNLPLVLFDTGFPVPTMMDHNWSDIRLVSLLYCSTSCVENVENVGDV